MARAAYGGRRRLYDSARARGYDFSGRPGLAWSQIALPAGAPEDFIDPEILWNAVESGASWGRPNLACEIIMGLPRGRLLSAHAAFVGGFLEEAFVTQACAVDWSIHYDRERNLHAHALVSPPWMGTQGSKLPERPSPEGMTAATLRALWRRHCERQGVVDGITPNQNSVGALAAACALGGRGVVTRLSQGRLALRALAARPFGNYQPPWLRVRLRRKERERGARAPRRRLGRDR